VAGKTLRGAGDGDDGTPYEDDDARGVFSGPTVVDDRKVEDAIRKLHTLDRPPGPLTGVTEAVVDYSSSEPTRIEDRSRSLARPTAVGRSLATPGADVPVTIPADAARGTMFGRSIHLPDINTPDGEIEDLSSGQVFLIDSESGPQAISPFPLAEPAARAAPRAAAPAAPALAPLPDAEPPAAGRPWYDDIPEATLPPRRWPRVVAMVAGVGVIGGAALLFVVRGEGSKPVPTPTATAPVAAPADDPPPPQPPPPAAAAAQPPAAAEAPPAAEAPAAAAPAAAEAPAAVEAPAAAEAEAKEAEPTPRSPPAARGNAEVAGDTRTATRRKPAARRSEPKLGPAAEKAPSSKANRARRRVFIREDPDATMAPMMD
jgi:hypothetical protein